MNTKSLENELIEERAKLFLCNAHITFNKQLSNLNDDTKFIIRKNKQLNDLYDLFLDFILDSSDFLDKKKVVEIKLNSFKLKEMNYKSFITRFVNLYIYRVCQDREQVLNKFSILLKESENITYISKFNDESKFIKRFYNWWSNLNGKKADYIFNQLDTFFENENFYWEDYISYVGSN